MSDKNLHDRDDRLDVICGVLENHSFDDYQLLHSVRVFIWYSLNRGILTDDDLCNLVHQYPQLLFS